MELAAPRDCIELTGGRLHYVESSADDLRLEMCSLLPKDGFVTITLIGGSVDDAMSNRDNLAVIRRFVATSRARRILPADSELRIRCVCNPSIVVGTATMPFAHRAAAIGDMGFLAESLRHLGQSILLRNSIATPRKIRANSTSIIAR